MTSWTVACQTSLYRGLPRKEYWSGLPFPSPGDLPDPGIKSISPALAGRLFTTERPGKPLSGWTRAKSLQLCQTLYDPLDYSPPGSSVHGFSRQEYWSGLPCPAPGGLPNLGIELTSLTSHALAGGFFTTSATWEAPFGWILEFNYITMLPSLCQSLP